MNGHLRNNVRDLFLYFEVLVWYFLEGLIIAMKNLHLLGTLNGCSNSTQ
jgi:hypothetical protein